MIKAIPTEAQIEAKKLWEACSSYQGENHPGWCEMNFIKFWEEAQKRQAAMDVIDIGRDLKPSGFTVALRRLEAAMSGEVVSGAPPTCCVCGHKIENGVIRASVHRACNWRGTEEVPSDGP